MPRSADEMTGFWHFDKRVPIAILLAILVQTGGAIWWAATISARVDRLDEMVGVRITDGDRLIALEIKLSLVREQLIEVDSKVDLLLSSIRQVTFGE